MAGAQRTEPRRFGETVKAYIERFEKEADWQRLHLPVPPIPLSVIADKMRGSGGIISTIADKCGVDRTVINEFLTTYPMLQEALKAAQEEWKDEVEKKLKKRIDEGDKDAQKVFVTSRLSDRGYSTKAGKGEVMDAAGLKSKSAKEAARLLSPSQRTKAIIKSLEKGVTDEGDGDPE